MNGGTGGSEVRAVWTDFGGVLTPPTAQTFLAFCSSMGLPPMPLLDAVTKVGAQYGTEDLMEPLDTPLVTETVWLEQVAEVLARDHGVQARLDSLADAWFDGREVNRPWLTQIRTLRERGLFIGMLSNMVPAWDQHWRRMVPPQDAFDDVILSFEVGTRKPQQQIFELAARRAGVPAAQCLLVDDSAENCAGAELAGWKALHFTDTAAAIAASEALVGSGSGDPS